MVASYLRYKPGMSALDNRWLVVNANVILTPIIEPVLIELDHDFELVKKMAFVTSGLRDANSQLRIIRQYLSKKGLDKKYPDAMTCQVIDRLPNGEYAWQLAWSNLLHVGVIINPPLAARCLMDYFKNGKNLKGVEFKQTAHANGTCANIGGGGNGVDDELPVIMQAMKRGVPGLVSFVTERENNALHLNCRKVI